MADLITRPDSRLATEREAPAESLPERLIETQSPQRPQVSPRTRLLIVNR